MALSLEGYQDAQAVLEADLGMIIRKEPTLVLVIGMMKIISTVINNLPNRS